MPRTPIPATPHEVQVRRLKAENQALRDRLAQLEAIATTDPLTRLANRRGADQRLEEFFAASVRYGTDLACLMIDLDGLKGVNDLLGHAQGDELIRAAAETIRATIRRSDFAARLGGDEFLVLLPVASSRTGAALAERLRAAFGVRCTELARRLSADQSHPSHPRVHVRVRASAARKPAAAVTPRAGAIGMSIGVASRLDSPTSGPQSLVQLADQALYAAKHAGKGCIRVDPAAVKATLSAA